MFDYNKLNTYGRISLFLPLMMSFFFLDFSYTLKPLLLLSFDCYLKSLLVSCIAKKSQIKPMLSLKRHDTTLKYRRNSNTLYSTTSLPSFSSELAETTNVGQSKVDAIVFLFETGHYQQQRRHSLDSYHYNLKRTLIHEREFEFLPTVNEWRKREYGPPPFKYQLPISLSVSVSTPV